jgi:hypothetical protein
VDVSRSTGIRILEHDQLSLGLVLALRSVLARLRLLVGCGAKVTPLNITGGLQFLNTAATQRSCDGQTGL